MVIIKGIGWINQDRYGCINKKRDAGYGDEKSLHALFRQAGIFTYPVNNFGRFDFASKITCALVGLALFDAGLTYREGEKKRKVGIIGANKSGSLESNLKYFRDYIDSGRKLARGNLFIYTIPSSPLAEASIHFSLQGPIFYYLHPDKPINSLIKCAEGLILRREAQTMLVVWQFQEQEGFCAVLSQSSPKKSQKSETVDEFLKKLTQTSSTKDLANILNHEN